jgi:hypothetical protein
MQDEVEQENRNINVSVTTGGHCEAEGGRCRCLARLSRLQSLRQPLRREEGQTEPRNGAQTQLLPQREQQSLSPPRAELGALLIARHNPATAHPA